MDVANVIVADDEALLRWALVQRLARDGHAVTEASDGAAALDALAHVGPPTVVLLDVKLPDMPGLVVLEEIRRRRPDAAVVMMTAYWASEALAEARRLGVRDLLAKPLDLDRVAAAVLAAKEIGTC
jgi:DNA-binding NtrC family response regulator